MHCQMRDFDVTMQHHMCDVDVTMQCYMCDVDVMMQHRMWDSHVTIHNVFVLLLSQCSINTQCKRYSFHGHVLSMLHACQKQKYRNH